MSKEQVRMMSAEDKLVGEADSPLTKLFRLVLKEMRMEPERWNKRLTMFLKSRWSRVRKTAKDIGQERNNFNRAISKRDITWKTFQKAVQISGPVEYSMGITMRFKDGSELSVSTGTLKNPLAELDSLRAAVTGAGNSLNDTTDYEDEEEDFGFSEEASGKKTMRDLTSMVSSLSSTEPPSKRQLRSTVIERNAVRHTDFEFDQDQSGQMDFEFDESD